MKIDLVHLNGGAAIPRLRFGGYLELQAAGEKLDTAVRQGDSGSIAEAIFLSLQTSIDIDKEQFYQLPWYEIISIYSRIRLVNRIPGAKEIAIISNPNKVMDEDKGGVPWNYPGRAGYAMINVIAKAYGWSLAQIRNLWPEDALKLLQEIRADEVSQNEFIYALSDRAYQYDQTTKKSKFIPYPKPGWMTVPTNQEEKLKRLQKLGGVPENMKPLGLIVTAPDAEDSDG